MPIKKIPGRSEEGISSLLSPGEVYINDSLYTNLKWHLTRIGKKERGILSLIDIRDLGVGRNVLKINYKRLDDGQITITYGDSTSVGIDEISYLTKAIVFYKDTD